MITTPTLDPQTRTPPHGDPLGRFIQRHRVPAPRIRRGGLEEAMRWGLPPFNFQRAEPLPVEYTEGYGV